MFATGTLPVQAISYVVVHLKVNALGQFGVTNFGSRSMNRAPPCPRDSCQPSRNGVG